MSYRELKTFSELMRHFHYSHPINSETFRLPNPLLTFHSLHFLLKQLSTMGDSDSSSLASIPVPPLRYEDAPARITFLLQCAEIAWREWRLGLNVKRIYRCNGYAVRELLKVARLVEKARLGRVDLATLNSSGSSGRKQKSSAANGESPSARIFSSAEELTTLANTFNQKDFMERARTLRNLSQQLTTLLPQMDEMLGHEAEVQEEREEIVGTQHDSESIRDTVLRQNQEAQDMVKNLTESIQSMQRDENSYQMKKKKKESELERSKKRLSRMETFRPTFMDEYEQREQELQQMFEEYSVKTRTLEYLEHELGRYRQAELRQIEEKERQMESLRKRIREEELRILRGGGMDPNGSFDLSPLTDNTGFVAGRPQDRSPLMARPRAASGRRPAAGRVGGSNAGLHPAKNQAVSKVVVKGSMYDDEDEETDEETSSSYMTDEAGEEEEDLDDDESMGEVESDAGSSDQYTDESEESYEE
mmetsp:Transcript_11265/g.42185  ORF Transcript_11265/g.42185 Transcript_11265/m.42185 type:complete len:476 (-) Transcript_11265:3956-5383(-)